MILLKDAKMETLFNLAVELVERRFPGRLKVYVQLNDFKNLVYHHFDKYSFDWCEEFVFNKMIPYLESKWKIYYDITEDDFSFSRKKGFA